MVRPSELSVTRATKIRDAMQVIDKGGIGLALVLDPHDVLERTLTDGDVRRALLSGAALDDPLATLPTKPPVVIDPSASRRFALGLMRDHGVSCLPVVDTERRVIDIWHRSSLDDQVLLSTPHMGEAEREFVEQAFATNWIAPLGPNVDAFERDLATTVGIGHAAAVSSGTAAIHLALRLLNVGPGDRVFCSTLTFAASANPIVYQGAEPVFIDSERRSWGMCPDALQRALEASSRAGKLPRAVIIVNLYGQSADMDPLLELCRHYAVPVVEDAAESLGALYKGRPSGTFGLMGIFSFNGNKIITTSGGGMLVSENRDLIERARFLATQARDPAPHYEHSQIGYNYRMSNILAGVGRGQLGVLKDRVAARRGVFETYKAGLSGFDGFEWMPEPDWSVSTRWLSACTVDPELIGRDQVIASLADELIEARPVWKPMHMQPVFAGCDFYSATNSAVADQLFQDGLCLPSGSNLRPDQLERIVSVLRKTLSADG
jgi:dTDP-4-amino-4,6-dideoxygalactose transaminase